MKVLEVLINSFRNASKIWDEMSYPECYICGRHIDEVLNHPADKEIIDKTIRELRIGEEKEITLSFGNKITISK